ncbi:MAG: diacylglycerol kinase family lipid kinase [Ruminococcus sp.]|nr:MAG: diacylglycerol kinase family lipid kinase [Ruminococcus sp.]
MKKLLFVYNPHSGKCQILTHLAEIIDIFTKGGYEVTAHPTQARDDAMETVRRRAADFDLIVSSGGDGTTNETIKGIMESGCNIPVGIIPAGTMNDFASSIGIPKYMPDAARVIAGGTPRYVDIGAFNGRYFTYVAAFGVFTQVSYATDQQLKNTWGALAYMTAAVREALQKGELNQKYSITIECNGQTIKDDFIFGMVSNSLSVGGIKGLAGNDVQMNDGIFRGNFHQEALFAYRASTDPQRTYQEKNLTHHISTISNPQISSSTPTAACPGHLTANTAELKKTSA